MRMPIGVLPAMILFSDSTGAQASGVIDEGSFTVTRAGVAHGTESFKIVRRIGPDGVEYVAHGTRTVDGRIVKTALTTDSNGSPTAYARMTTGAASGQLNARRALNRLTVNEEGARASSRDYMFSAGTLLLEADVIHPLHFVAWVHGRAVAFVMPAERASGRAAIAEVGREGVVIGGATIPATKFTFGSADAMREVWIDSGKRLLKVTHPSRQIVVLRDLPPR